MRYDASFFLEFFTPIPEDDWCEGETTIGHRHCAMGHVREKHKGDFVVSRLCNMFYNKLETCVVLVNDNRTGKYPQKTAKERVLAALYDIKSLEALIEAQEIVNTEAKDEFQFQLQETFVYSH